MGNKKQSSRAAERRALEGMEAPLPALEGSMGSPSPTRRCQASYPVPNADFKQMPDHSQGGGFCSTIGKPLLMINFIPLLF